MRRKGKIEELVLRGARMKKAILPAKNISKASTIFAYTWRLAIAVLFISVFSLGYNPFVAIEKTILALSGSEGSVALYATSCSSDYAGLDKENGWWREPNATGAPSLPADADIKQFDDINSAVYAGGHSNFSCGGFDQNADEGEKKDVIETKEENVPVEATMTPVDAPAVSDAATSVNEATSSDDIATPKQEVASTSGAIVPEQETASTTEQASSSVELPADVATTTAATEEATSAPVVDEQKINDVKVIDLPSTDTAPSVEAKPAEGTESANILSDIFSPIADSLFGYLRTLKAMATDEKKLEDFGDFAGAKLKISYAVTAQDQASSTDAISKPVFTVWYAVDNDASATSSFWQELTTVYSGEISNASNNGYASFDIPGLAGWEDLKKVKIRIEGKEDDNGAYRAFIDSVWVEGVYETHKEMKRDVTAADHERWDKMMDNVSDNKDFKMGDRVDMRFRYKKNFRSLVNIFDATSYWSDVNLSASLVDANGNAASMPLTIIFEDDGYFNVRAIDMPREFRPGKYSVRFSIQDNSGVLPETIDITRDFSWGVLALNSNKSIYLPGESAYLQMAVLDDLGHTLCDANLTMTVTAPDGGAATLSTSNGLIERNPECGPDNVIKDPDYFAHYGVAGAGTYQIMLTATTGNGVRTITDSFEVRDSVPFDVERIGPTRIFPKADYKMTIKIRVNEDYNGDIVDVVPASFNIVDQKIFLNGQAAGTSYQSNLNGSDRVLDWQNVGLKKGDELDIGYDINFPYISPEFYLVGPLSIGAFQEARKWQIASDAVQYRAKTVQFLGGTYSANGTTGQNTDTNQTFSAFNFRLMENNVTIKDAYVVLEYMYGAYTASQGPYTGANLAFDSCAGASCGANAWTGISSVALNDTTTQAYNETESDMQRVILDVTSEAQLAAYSGNGSMMQAQIGYRVDRGTAANSISYAKAVLYITYTYDKNSSPNLTNTVIYPLESTAAGDSGTKRASQATNCVFGSTCPGLTYNMSIPEYDTTAGSAQLSQWFQVTEQNDLNVANDVTVNLKIGSNATSSSFVHESALSDQANMPWMYFPSVAGYAENTAQTVEYRAAATALTSYLIGGEVVETYTASSSAPVKTRTVSFPIGSLTDGLTTATTTGYADVYFPENGSATGTVKIKKAWFRVVSNDRASAAYTTNVQTKIGNNASSTPVLYNYNAAATIINPTFNIIHVASTSDYAELENASASNAKRVYISTRNSNAVNIGGVTAELMITYTYSDDSKGYLSSLNISAGQPLGNPSQSTSTAAANLIAPEFAGKTMYGGTLKATYLTSGSAGAMTATSSIADANISTAISPTCTNSFRLGDAAQNTFNEFNKKIAAANLGTTDGQALNACYSHYSGAALTAQVSKMNGYLNYTYGWVDTPPTSTISSMVQRRNGTGIVDIMFTANDVDKDDLKAKLEYEAGTTCAFSSASKLTLDSVASSTYGTITIDNNSAYQVGTSSGPIITSSGMNTVEVGWPSQSNLANIDNTYCVRLVSNDGVYDQSPVATATILIDNLAPTAPGALTATSILATSTYITFGATTMENHFAEYKIFYKVYDGTPVSELDTAITSSTVSALGDKNFLTATSTQVTLAAGTPYSFNIWAYDTFGNKSSSTQIDFNTNSLPISTINSVSEKSDGSGAVDISFTADDPDNDNTLRAKLEYEAGSSCAFSSASKATIDTNQSNIYSTYGIVHVDNSVSYQVGTSSYWIQTSPGANTLNVDWLSKQDVPNANGVYCLRLTVNDGKNDQLLAATSTVLLDNISPTVPGALSDGGKTISSITLVFGATTTDSNFSQYKIFYKAGTSGVTEANTEYSSSTVPGDPNLGMIDFNSATSTTISSLISNTNYVFNIWAYDTFGNKASSTEVTIKTNATVSNDSLAFTNPQTGNIAVANGTNEWDFRAVVSELSGWHVLASTTLLLYDSTGSNDLAFKWNETTDSFSESGTDILNAASISPNSTSTCSGNTCTLDFKIVFNYNFATSSTNYAAELITSNDSDVTDDDTYANIYQVKTIKVVQKHYRWRNDNGGN